MGNGWRKITLPYTVTAATVLAFDFVGNVESEIHANGLENDMDETIIKPQQSGTLSQWQLRAVFVVLVLLAGVVTWMIWSQFGTQLAAWGGAKSVAEMDQAHFTEETGVKITRIAVSAGGGMIDLRYQIADPDKAIIVHDDERPPTIIDERSGTVISRPWHEHSHDRDLHTAVIYYELLMNPEGIINPGSLVTIKIGDTILEHVRVQ